MKKFKIGMIITITRREAAGGDYYGKPQKKASEESTCGLFNV